MLQKLAHEIVISRWRYVPYGLPLSRLRCLHYHACVVCDTTFALFALSRWRYVARLLRKIAKIDCWALSWYFARLRALSFLSGESRASSLPDNAPTTETAIASRTLCRLP
jgi:hypothetical protein